MAIELGQPVPDFSAPATGDTTITLSELRGKQVVIYFYPKASTPGCTTEGGDFRDRKTAFDAANTVVIGVSGTVCAPRKTSKPSRISTLR